MIFFFFYLFREVRISLADDFALEEFVLERNRKEICEDRFV